MEIQTAGKAKPGTPLARIGNLSTIWWAVTCIYILSVIFDARTRYVARSIVDQNNNSAFDMSAWRYAISGACTHSAILKVLLVIILLGWLIGYYFWTQALKRAKIPLSTAHRDLFLTIRR